ncbi:unnamed protein product [Pocillopora meandrina]|uniref:Borealin N-terminal domain-containing protein n=1 Tax=Pocillopora meandrina TaxID=46732 RepID=A0AAU9W9K8_9CNID|nr:unnamed protein product [Pocillopora meandrina]
MNHPSDEPDDNQNFHDEISSTLKDVEIFLSDLAKESLQLHLEKQRDELLEKVIQLKKKVTEYKNSQMVTNGIKSPRPKRKSYPFAAVKDSMHTYAAHLQKINVDVKPKHPGSPEIRRSVDKPKMRPRSVSCPEIRFTLSHAWRTSLPKVPENEELKVDGDKGSLSEED